MPHREAFSKLFIAHSGPAFGNGATAQLAATPLLYQQQVEMIAHQNPGMLAPTVTSANLRTLEQEAA